MVEGLKAQPASTSDEARKFPRKGLESQVAKG